jgi:hypothetical protein
MEMVLVMELERVMTREMACESERERGRVRVKTISGTRPTEGRERARDRERGKLSSRG